MILDTFSDPVVPVETTARLTPVALEFSVPPDSQKTQQDEPKMLQMKVHAWHCKCSRHPGFQPSHGPGTIRAGWKSCRQHCKIYQAENALLAAICEFERLKLTAGAARGELLDSGPPATQGGTA